MRGKLGENAEESGGKLPPHSHPTPTYPAYYMWLNPVVPGRNLIFLSGDARVLVRDYRTFQQTAIGV